MEVKSVLLLISIAIFQIFCYSYFSDDSRWLREDSTSIAFGQSRIASNNNIRKIRSLNAYGQTNRLTISLTDENPNGSGFHTNWTSESRSTTNISSSVSSDVNLTDSKFSDNLTLRKIEETSTEKSIIKESSESSTENITSTSPTSYPLETSSLMIVDEKEIDNNVTMEQIDIWQTPKITTDAVNANFNFSLDVETTTTKNLRIGIDWQLNKTDSSTSNPDIEPSAFVSQSERIPNVTETSTKVSAETSITTNKFEFTSVKEQELTSSDTSTVVVDNSTQSHTEPKINASTVTVTEDNSTQSHTEPMVNSSTVTVIVDNSTQSYTEPTVDPITVTVNENNSTQSYTEPTVDPVTVTVTENNSTQSYTEPMVNSSTVTVIVDNSTHSYTKPTVDPFTVTVTEDNSTQSYTEPMVDPVTVTVIVDNSTQSYTEPMVNSSTVTVIVDNSTQSYTEPMVNSSTVTVIVDNTTQSHTEPTVDPVTVTATENNSTQSYTEPTVGPITVTVTENTTISMQPTTNSLTEQSSTQVTSIQPVTSTTIRVSTSQSITETSVTDFTTKDGNTTPFTHSTFPTNETASPIDQECDCHGDDLVLPQCKEICALSTNLSGFHINLAFFGLKIRMILSNRDYLICIGVFLGITLVLVGFVARMIQRRKRRRMIAQRNFEILYQDFGVQSEKTKKWLADYQSSIL